MKILHDLLTARCEGLENSGTHEYGPTADENGVINVRAEQFRWVELEQYTKPSEVRVETIGRSWEYQLMDNDYYKNHLR